METAVRPTQTKRMPYESPLRRAYRTMLLGTQGNVNDWTTEADANLDCLATDTRGHDTNMKIESATPTAQGLVLIVSRLEPVIDADLAYVLQGECEDAYKHVYEGTVAADMVPGVAESVVDVAFSMLWDDDTAEDAAFLLRAAWSTYLAEDTSDRWQQSREREAAICVCEQFLRQMVAAR